MPQVKKVIRNKVLKMVTPLYSRKSQQHGKEHMENRIQCVIINAEDV